MKGAPYNPRVMSEDARARLRDNIKRVGIIEPPIWNERTGNVVGGHQRLSVLDALEKTGDYMLSVAVVNLNPNEEKEQNVFLNNPSAQGEWDWGKLRDLFETPTFKIESSGFELTDVYHMFGESVMQDKPDELKDLADKIRSANDQFDAVRKRISDSSRSDVDYFMVIVFRNNKDRTAFAAKWGMEDNKWISGDFMDVLLTSGPRKKAVPNEPGKMSAKLKTKLAKA